jgi:methionyl-tRNA formyltransferase
VNSVQTSQAVTDVALLAVGDKGYHLLTDLLSAQSDIRVSHVVTYEQQASRYSTQDFAAACNEASVVCEIGNKPNLSAINADVIFAVGWQYLVDNPPENMVVLHDSLLPKYRGFAPTVAALIAGDTQLGVTALLPSDLVDAGPVITRRSVNVSGPISVRTAFDLLRPLYTHVILDVCNTLRIDGQLQTKRQDETQATYSLWLDEFDYLLNWSKSAEQLHRQVLAQSSPYSGSLAVTTTGRAYRVAAASVLPDVVFVNRVVGKVWTINDVGPVVVCAHGLLQLQLQDTTTGQPAKPLRLRTRFADAVHAQILLSGRHDYPAAI